MPASLRSDYPIKPLVTSRPFSPEEEATFTGMHIMQSTGFEPKHEAPKTALNERQLKAVEYLQSHESVTPAEYQNLLGVSRATATRDLADLADKGLVIQIGRAKATAYRRP